MGWIGLPASIMKLDLQQKALFGLWLIIPFYVLPHFEFGLDNGLALLLTTTLSFIIAVLKESKEPNKFNWLNIAATAGATFIGSLLLLILI